MRRAIVPFLVAAFVSVPGLARAEDEKPGDWVTPEHSYLDYYLTGAALPSGWTLLPDDPSKPTDAAKAILKELETLAKARGLSYDADVKAVKAPDGATATVALVDTDKHRSPKDFPAALGAVAEAKGWAFREIASRARLMVVAAPEAIRDQVVSIQEKWTIRRLGEQAVAALDDGEWHEARGLARGLLRLAPKDARAHFAMGVSEFKEASRDRSDEGFAVAAKRFRDALSKDATAPLTGITLQRAKADLAGALLSGKLGDAEARDILVALVKEPLAAGAPAPEPFLWRYNLACAHGRLAEKDAAFEQIAKVLEADAKTPMPEIGHWREDGDFKNLYDDPRWKALLEKYPKKEPAGGGGGGG